MPYSNVPKSQVIFSELLSLQQSLMSNSDISTTACDYSMNLGPLGQQRLQYKYAYLSDIYFPLLVEIQYYSCRQRRTGKARIRGERSNKLIGLANIVDLN